MRVLVVEDDMEQRTAWLDAVRTPGRLAVGVRTSSQAVHLMRFTRFDLIVMNMMLQSGSALPLARYAAETAPDTRVIAVTSDELPNEETMRAVAPSIIRTLRPPFSAGELIDLAAQTERTLH